MSQLEGWDRMGYDCSLEIRTKTRERLPRLVEAELKKRMEDLEGLQDLLTAHLSKEDMIDVLELNGISAADMAITTNTVDLACIISDGIAHGLAEDCPICGHTSLVECHGRVACWGFLEGLTKCAYKCGVSEVERFRWLLDPLLETADWLVDWRRNWALAHAGEATTAVEESEASNTSISAKCSRSEVSSESTSSKRQKRTINHTGLVVLDKETSIVVFPEATMSGANARREEPLMLGRSDIPQETLSRLSKRGSAVSREHFTLIEREEEKKGAAASSWRSLLYAIEVTDNSSVNGIFVNGLRVDRATLHAGDTLTVGAGRNIAVGQHVAESDEKAQKRAWHLVIAEKLLPVHDEQAALGSDDDEGGGVAPSDLDRLSVVELKRELKRRGLAQNGKKQTLKARLAAASDSSNSSSSTATVFCDGLAIARIKGSSSSPLSSTSMALLETEEAQPEPGSAILEVHEGFEQTGLRSRAQILVDDDLSTVYSASFIQVHMASNVNRFYIVQLLRISTTSSVSSSSSSLLRKTKPYVVFTHWGKVGVSWREELDEFSYFGRKNYNTCTSIALFA